MLALSDPLRAPWVQRDLSHFQICPLQHTHCVPWATVLGRHPMGLASPKCWGLPCFWAIVLPRASSGISPRSEPVTWYLSRGTVTFFPWPLHSWGLNFNWSCAFTSGLSWPLTVQPLHLILKYLDGCLEIFMTMLTTLMARFKFPFFRTFFPQRKYNYGIVLQFYIDKVLLPKVTVSWFFVCCFLHIN